MFFEKILDNHQKFYKEITVGENKHIIESLSRGSISLLDGFIENIDIVNEFYKIVYQKNNVNRIVLCGINPGRNGAGKTGVPFIDNLSLSKILSKIEERDSEPSAQFVWSVISKFNNFNEFFDSVYLTNISWLGFTKNGNNYQYYELENELRVEFIKGFVQEMNIVKPYAIIPLSIDVNKDINILKNKYNKNWNVINRLNHPSWCSFNTERANEWCNRYYEEIKRQIEKSKTST